MPIWRGLGRSSNKDRTSASGRKGRQKNPLAWRLMTSRRNHSHTSCLQTFARGAMLDRSPTPRQTVRAHLLRVLIQISYAKGSSRGEAPDNAESARKSRYLATHISADDPMQSASDNVHRGDWRVRLASPILCAIGSGINQRAGRRVPARGILKRCRMVHCKIETYGGLPRGWAPRGGASENVSFR